MIQIINYAPLWETMKSKNITTYALREKHNINSATIYRMKNSRAVSLNTLDDLCHILDCEIEDIIKHVKEDKGPGLNQ